MPANGANDGTWNPGMLLARASAGGAAAGGEGAALVVPQLAILASWGELSRLSTALVAWRTRGPMKGCGAALRPGPSKVADAAVLTTQVVEPIGSGASGMVCRGEFASTPVAVKILHQKQAVSSKH